MEDRRRNEFFRARCHYHTHFGPLLFQAPDNVGTFVRGNAPGYTEQHTPSIEVTQHGNAFWSVEA
jgi:hypothetical protein